MLDLPENILAGYEKKLLALSGYPVQQLFNILSEMPHSEGCYIRGEKLYLALPVNLPSEIVREFALKQGLANVKIEDVTPDVEDVFIDRLVEYQKEKML
jgi:hypothetical protein